MFKYQKHGRRVWSTKVGVGLNKSSLYLQGFQNTGFSEFRYPFRRLSQGPFAPPVLLYSPASCWSYPILFQHHLPQSVFYSYTLSFIWTPLPLSLHSGCRRELPGPEMCILRQELSCEAPGFGCLSMCLRYQCLKWQWSPIHRRCYVRLPRWLLLCQSFGLL